VRPVFICFVVVLVLVVIVVVVVDAINQQETEKNLKHLYIRRLQEHAARQSIALLVTGIEMNNHILRTVIFFAFACYEFC